MASLIALPAELLVLICEHVGGREFRRSQTGRPRRFGSGWRATEKLGLCREWYAAARPVYLSGLHVSEVRLHACNLDRLKGELSYKGSRALMHKNTRSLTIKLLGHFWDDQSAEDIERWHSEDNWCGPFEANREPAGMTYETRKGKQTLKAWRDNSLQPCLEELFKDLGLFSTLKYLDFRASSDPHGAGPDWDYLYQSTIVEFLQNIPLTQSLRTLVLDTCGTRLVGDAGQAHVCEEIARILPSIENVRLRMISICPCIFNIPRDSKRPLLKTLIVKLYLPLAFEHTRDAACEPCTYMQATLGPEDRLSTDMCRAAPVLLRRLAELHATDVDRRADPGYTHGMTGFTISHRRHMLARIEVWNCLHERETELTENVSIYPDDDDWHEFSGNGMA